MSEKCYVCAVEELRKLYQVGALPPPSDNAKIIALEILHAKI